MQQRSAVRRFDVVELQAAGEVYVGASFEARRALSLQAAAALCGGGGEADGLRSRVAELARVWRIPKSGDFGYASRSRPGATAVLPDDGFRIAG